MDQKPVKRESGQGVHIDMRGWIFCLRCKNDKPLLGARKKAYGMFMCADCLKEKADERAVREPLG